MPNFILMLTHRDVTVHNAMEIFEEIKTAGVSHIGFKDVGLAFEELKELVEAMRRERMNIYLEVVSDSEESAIRSTMRAVELGVDYIIGGTYVERMLGVIGKRETRFFPYVGNVVGHPCLLRGTIDQIIEDARRVEKMGAYGINLLAYRYDGNAEQLITSIQNAVKLPLIIAGSIDSFEKIEKMKDMQIWGFTIGGAVIERKLLPGKSTKSQVEAVLKNLQSHV